MIFVTVGEQLPFDRLIKTVDKWAAEVLDESVFAQIGKSHLKPTHIAYKKFLSPEEFREKMTSADFIVAHAGMGTIISALEIGTPIIVMPRQAALGEHRNDHQLATAKQFSSLDYVTTIYDEDSLTALLNRRNEQLLGKTTNIDSGASLQLIQTIRNFIFDDI